MHTTRTIGLLAAIVGIGCLWAAENADAPPTTPASARLSASAGGAASRPVPVGVSRPAATAASGTSAYAPENIEQLHDVVIGTGSGRELHAEVAWPKVLPKEPMPVMLQIHGGGWNSGSHKPAILYKVFAEHGYFGASIEYRLTPEAVWPAQIEDCKLAARWIRANTKKYHVNPDAIGCLGISAGGHLAACLGALDDPNLEGKGGHPDVSSKVQLVVVVCGPTDLVPKDPNRRHGLFGCSPKENLAAIQAGSPLYHVRAGLPPFLLVHGDKDEFVPLAQSESFMAALKKARVPVEFLVVKDAPHALNLLQPDIRDTILRFCDKHLKPQGQTK